MNYSLAKKITQNERSSTPVSLFVKGNVEEIISKSESLNGTVKYSAGDIVAITIPLNKVSSLANNKDVLRMEDSEMKLELMNDRMLANNNVTPVHLGITPLTSAYKGKDIVMGVIDTGIDYTHPDFKDFNGKSRIKYIWDHNLPPGTNSPFPYNYGEEFTDSMIDNNLASDHYDRINGHGTHVAGIAAGNGIAVNNYTGVAPEADLVIVSLDFNLGGSPWLTSVADAVSYIFEKADALGKPCVINISAGTYFGSHDGKDLQAQVIDNLITQQNGRSVVCAAGNAGNIPIHTRNNVNSDTTFTWFDFTSGSIVIDMWADTTDLNQVEFAIGADNTSPAFSYRGRTDFRNVQNQLGFVDADTIFNGSNRIAVVQYFGQLVDDRYVMSCNIIPDSTTYLFRLMATGSGMFDVWSFEMVSSNLPSPTDFPDILNYVTPDLEQNMVSSFACSDEVITVAQYINRNWYTDVNGNIQTFPTVEGAIADASSKGPTRDGRIKPDIAATGDATLSCADLSSIPWFLANQPFKLAAGGKHIRDGGTSSSSPVVAGIIALLMEQNPSADNQDIKNALLSCVKTDAFTGTSL
ncbi:MAG: S8 family serine peptidase, partial [Bacteroidia bacterium]|nr:S8 family serine peptidase [Bacteroidia bacterium]NNM15453.1 S8 family serine peptidase [Bacteroidia bacterium]